MRPELREKIIAYSRTVAANREKADDFTTVLGALPPGQIKNLLRDATIGPILKKYGITERDAMPDEKYVQDTAYSPTDYAQAWEVQDG